MSNLLAIFARSQFEKDFQACLEFNLINNYFKAKYFKHMQFNIISINLTVSTPKRNLKSQQKPFRFF